MKICIVCPYGIDTPGGVWNHVFNLTQQLQIKRINKLGGYLHRDIDYQTPKKIISSTLHSNISKSEYINSIKKYKNYCR